MTPIEVFCFLPFSRKQTWKLPTGLRTHEHATCTSEYHNFFSKPNCFTSLSTFIQVTQDVLRYPDTFRVFEKSIELFRLKFTSSEIISTEWQRCIVDMSLHSAAARRRCNRRGAGPSGTRRGRERDGAVHTPPASERTPAAKPRCIE